MGGWVGDGEERERERGEEGNCHDTCKNTIIEWSSTIYYHTVIHLLTYRKGVAHTVDEE